MEQKDKIALDRAKLYIPLHKRKDGTPVNEAAAAKIVTDGSSGIPDQASLQTYQRSSFGSHEMQPSNRGKSSL
ncbi:hypothetical protein CsSME_00043233 [Camellia sinensis var. sinensis]